MIIIFNLYSHPCIFIRKIMSLNVSDGMVRQAALGTVDAGDFADTIRQSLPYA